MQDWQRHRRYLFAVAYRLLGSAADAEDAVQETFLRLHTAGPDDLRDPRAWLTTVVSRICLDMLGSAHARRVSYVGTWLPEPIPAGDDTDLGDVAVRRESVRTAVLLILEALTPAERVAFVLHDVFGMEFEQIATVVQRTPAACRQLASRARRRVHTGAPRRVAVSPDEHRRVAAAFLKAGMNGDLETLLTLLDPEVVLRSDGGGIVPSARVPIHGSQEVVRLLSGLTRLYAGAVPVPMALASGEGAVLVLGGAVIGVAGLELEGARIAEVKLVVNPEKLRRFSAA